MKKSKIMKILVVVLSIFIITGCTTTLKDPKNKKVVTYEDEKVKITLNENILCKPTNKGLIKNIINIKNKLIYLNYQIVINLNQVMQIIITYGKL